MSCNGNRMGGQDETPSMTGLNTMKTGLRQDKTAMKADWSTGRNPREPGWRTWWNITDTGWRMGWHNVNKMRCYENRMEDRMRHSREQDWTLWKHKTGRRTGSNNGTKTEGRTGRITRIIGWRTGWSAMNRMQYNDNRMRSNENRLEGRIRHNQGQD
jgi:hypothetical protein